MYRTLMIALLSCLLIPPAPAAAAEDLLPPTHAYRPATIYFGAYRRNEPLADHPEQWPFVRQHADGFLMHFGFWLNNDYKADPVATGKKLGPILREAKLKTLLEIGWPRPTEPPEIAADMGRHFGKQFVDKIKRFEAESGMRVDEIECELRHFVINVVTARFPEWTEADIFQQITGKPMGDTPSALADRAYWPEFVQTMRDGLGDRPIHVGCPPVYVPWKGLFTAAKHYEFPHPADVGTDGKPTKDARHMRFDGQQFWDAMLSPETTGFLCDSPWYLMTHPVYTQRGYHQKIVDFERFVHARGKQFTFIANNAVDKNLPEAEWDRKYLEDTMKAITTFQLAGGRADSYLLESWYAGPYTIVPEDQPNTFTNLVKQAILYLKGPGQKLTLSAGGEKEGRVRAAGASVQITLKNEGEVAALPAVRVRPNGAGAGRHAFRATIEDADVSIAAMSREGATPARLLPPGESLTLTITAAGETTVEAFWNPQDPSNTPRATLIVRFN